MYGHVDLPTEYFSWKKESGSSQCEDGCAFQDKVFTVDGFDKLCLTHCGEVENAILKDASKGQRKGIALANVRGTMLSETERKRQRLVQAHEPWNLDASPVEKKKYYELRRQRFERGESSRGPYPATDLYPMDAMWGKQSAHTTSGGRMDKAAMIELAQTKDKGSSQHTESSPLSRQQYKRQIKQHGMVWYGIP